MIPAKTTTPTVESQQPNRDASNTSGLNFYQPSNNDGADGAAAPNQSEGGDQPSNISTTTATNNNPQQE